MPQKATVAVARKLTVAVGHVMQGHVIGAVENVPRLRAKVYKVATDIGLSTIKALGHKSKNALSTTNLPS